jgi:hypothetical protein
VLQRQRPKPLNAPSWLWNGVVDLAGGAFLEHCWRYATEEAA